MDYIFKKSPYFHIKIRYNSRMEKITYGACEIYFPNQDFTMLNDLIRNRNYSKIFILTDENTSRECLPGFIPFLEFEPEIIEIESGEEHKTIETCLGVWESLSELGADRKSLLINLGGGVITDLGGFVACTFKRGMAYVNIPTSLLSMVDASVGGKTGVDLGLLKNQIGVISNPEMVIIDTSFLSTLPKAQLRSGYAEMLKHGLISNLNYWENLINLKNLTEADLLTLIVDSVLIKKNIVEKDPTENGIRKFLNFGHTLGHAIESYSLSGKKMTPLLHGEAIAIGMVLESYLSTKVKGFPASKTEEIKTFVISFFGKVEIDETCYEAIIELMKFDKKNEHGKINFVLLEDIGKPVYDCQVDNQIVIEALNFYNS